MPAPAPQAYNGAIRVQLAELQRGRILTAMFDVCDERGAANVTVAHVVQRAGLVANTGIGPGQGAPNAWRLTDKGAAITQSVRLYVPDDEKGVG